jgi:hypothetical protein
MLMVKYFQSLWKLLSSKQGKTPGKWTREEIYIYIYIYIKQGKDWSSNKRPHSKMKNAQWGA